VGYTTCNGYNYVTKFVINHLLWCLRNIYFAFVVFVPPYILYDVEVYGNTRASIAK